MYRKLGALEAPKMGEFSNPKMLPYSKKNVSIEQTAGLPARPDQISVMLEKLSRQDTVHFDRESLLHDARSLVSALETPRETFLRICWAEVSSRWRNFSVSLTFKVYKLRCYKRCFGS